MRISSKVLAMCAAQQARSIKVAPVSKRTMATAVSSTLNFSVSHGPQGENKPFCLPKAS